MNPFRTPMPPAAVTETSPGADSGATTALMLAVELTVNEAAGLPPKLTALTAKKFWPFISTVTPPIAVDGLKELITGGSTKINPSRLAVPPPVVTDILPLDAPGGTTTVIVFDETCVNEARSPPTLTKVTPSRFEPETVTIVPTPTAAGEKESIVGAGKNTKPAAVTVAAGVVTEITPLDPLAGMAMIVVEDNTVKDAAATPPKLTALLPNKLVPEIIMVVPIPALEGVKEEMVGGKAKINPGSSAIPSAVVTETLPVSPVPTTALMVLAEITVKLAAGLEPKFTFVTSVNALPVIVTVVPLAAIAGVKDLILNIGVKTKLLIAAVPPGVLTTISPLSPSPTNASIFSEEMTLKEAASTPPKLTEDAPIKFAPKMVTNDSFPERTVV